MLFQLVCGTEKTRLLLTQTVNAGFGAIASAFLVECVQHMIPWLIVTFAVMICGFLARVRCRVLMGESIELPREVRIAMGDAVVYYSVIMVVCMTDVAAGGSVWIERSSCLVVCGLELWSILANILRPKGIVIDGGRFIGVLFGKALAKDMDGVFRKEDEREKE